MIPRHLALLTTLSLTLFTCPAYSDPLPGTSPLTWDDDIAARIVAGADAFLLNETELSIERRSVHWARDFTSAQAYSASININRQRLRHILGIRDERKSFEGLEFLATTQKPALVGQGDGFEIYAVRWPVMGNIHGEGLLLVPRAGKQRLIDVIAIPDADQTPEQLVGLEEGIPEESQFARLLAEQGCRVVVPALINRDMQRRAPPGYGGRANLTNREYIYRTAFELGRHLIGYEVQKVLACVDWFSREAGDNTPQIGVMGYGEGGMTAFYAAAVDERIGACSVGGYFGTRESLWSQPIDRNVHGLLEQFGDAEIATMIAPRSLIIEASAGPEVSLPSEGGAPAELTSPTLEEVATEIQRVSMLMRDAEFDWNFHAVPVQHPMGSTWLDLISALVDIDATGVRVGAKPIPTSTFDADSRQQRLLQEMDEHNQWLLRDSDHVRRKFMNIGLTAADHPDGVNRLDTSSAEAYETSVERFREVFRHEVVGHFDYPLLPFNARSRKSYDEKGWTGHEVVLDVLPGIVAYGILCLPKDLAANEKRPVVVCQHGLEGRPQDVVTGDLPAYHDFASKLAERGFITFAPQNIYIFKDKFRTLQRKAYPLKKTIFSIMVPQHQQIVNWLKTLPNVDAERIAFYGLSYGGKSAMRIPSLVTDYCLSICSADFNEWVVKNSTNLTTFSYLFTGEYEIFEWDLGSTFNYAEMAALIAPRPFMVERGHFDGVGWDEWVGYEFAKVRHLYAARLHLADRCEIEWFVGPHTINGKGTYAFLHKHLDWPLPKN